jgi:hypothetical protein
MTDQDLIKAVAELDDLVLGSELGYTDCQSELFYRADINGHYHDLKDWQMKYTYVDFSPLTSYDAIIPVIQKQPEAIYENFVNELIYGKSCPSLKMYHDTPRQLCEALIAAAKKGE